MTLERATLDRRSMEDLKQLFSDLIRFETELWNAIDVRLRTEHDLPLHKFEPMQIIASRPDCRVYDIAGALSLTTGGVSKLVDAIESSGYCKRRPNPEDRRSSLAQATKTFERELELRLRSSVPTRTLAQFSSSMKALRAASAIVDESTAA
jgi:MarR family transcriptional regulator, organic hydroperoxide resistance regulator